MMTVTVSETFVVPDEAKAVEVANALVDAAVDLARGFDVALVRGETTTGEWDGPDFPLRVRVPEGVPS